MNRFTSLTLGLFLFSVSLSFGQEEESNNYIYKGQWIAGGKLSLSTGDDFDNYAFTVSPTGGYFITKKFAAGIQASYSHTNIFYDGSVVTTNNYISVSPFFRYYISTTRIAPFAEVMGGAYWSMNKLNLYSGGELTNKSSAPFFTVGMGLNYFISRDVALEGILHYTDGKDFGHLDFDLGLQFFFSRGNKSASDETGNYFSKGQWLIGGTGNLSLGALDDMGVHQVSVSPMAGYLIGNKIAVGLSTAYTLRKGNADIDGIFVGPFLRYYLTQKKLAPYAEVAYGGSWSRTQFNGEVYDKSSSSSYRIGAGINYFISKNVAFDGNLHYARSSDFDSGSLGFNVGLQFFIK